MDWVYLMAITFWIAGALFCIDWAFRELKRPAKVIGEKPKTKPKQFKSGQGAVPNFFID
jgi:hypothetical protein